MSRIKALVLAGVAALGVSTFTGEANAQYYPAGYYQTYGVQPQVQRRLTKKQIAKLRAREQARRERLARQQFLARQRAAYQQRYIYEEEPVPYVVQRQYVPQYQPQYVPQYQPQYQPQYVPPRPRPQVVQPQYVPQPQYQPQYVPPQPRPRIVQPQYVPPQVFPRYGRAVDQPQRNPADTNSDGR